MPGWGVTVGDRRFLLFWEKLMDSGPHGEELLAAARAGDQAAYWQLAETYRP